MAVSKVVIVKTIVPPYGIIEPKVLVPNNRKGPEGGGGGGGADPTFTVTDLVVDPP